MDHADKMNHVGLFGLFGFAIVACSGRVANESSEQVDPAQAAEYCQAIVNHYVACGNPRASGYCDSYIQCIEGVFRADVIANLTQCVQNLGCGQSDSSCVESISVSNTGAVFSDYKSACESRLAACESEFTSDQRFFCSEEELGATSDEYIQETEACLQQDCNSISGCMDLQSARHHCKG
jgi:hypothetical protein